MNGADWKNPPSASASTTEKRRQSRLDDSTTTTQEKVRTRLAASANGSRRSAVHSVTTPSTSSRSWPSAGSRNEKRPLPPSISLMKRAATASISSPLRTITWPARMRWKTSGVAAAAASRRGQRLAAIGVQVGRHVGEQQLLQRRALAPVEVEPAPALGLDHLARLLGIAQVAIEVELEHLLRSRQVAQHDAAVVVLQQLGLARHHTLAQDLADHALESLLEIGREADGAAAPRAASGVTLSCELAS